MSSTWVLCTPETPFNHLLPTFKYHWWIDQQDCSLWLIPPENGLLFYCFLHQLILFSALIWFPAHTHPLKCPPIGPGVHFYIPYFIVQNVCENTRLGTQRSEFNSGFSAFSMTLKGNALFFPSDQDLVKNYWDITDHIWDDSEFSSTEPLQRALS